MQKIYTVDEASLILKLHPKTIQKKIREEEIIAVKVGHQYRISQEEIDRLCGIGKNDSDKKDKKNIFFLSSVIDVDNISKEENISLTNTIIAVMNSSSTGTHVNCLYYEESKKVKIIVNGSLEYVPEILTMIRDVIKTVKGEKNE